jgi:hypothetical protein
MNMTMLERISQTKQLLSMALPNVPVEDASIFGWVERYQDDELAYAFRRAGTKLRCGSLRIEEAAKYISGVLKNYRMYGKEMPGQQQQQVRRPRGF